MCRAKYEEKQRILKEMLEEGLITLAEYRERENELYRYWLVYGVD